METYENILKLDELTEKYQEEAASDDNWVTHIKVDNIYKAYTSHVTHIKVDNIYIAYTTHMTHIKVDNILIEYINYSLLFRLMGWPTDVWLDNSQKRDGEESLI